MGYKKIDRHLGFVDLALASSLKHNRSLKFMDKLNKTIDWSRGDQILMNHYTVGTSGEGAGAWPPLLLFKCMMLQKWFRIQSDPELENQINDRLSFKNSSIYPLANPLRTIPPFRGLEKDYQKTPSIKSTPRSCVSSKAEG